MHPRHLVSVRRRVTPALRAEYEALWAALHAGATAHGAHAWRFASAADAALALEFLEFRADADPRHAAATAAALRALDERVSPGAVEEWIEWGVESRES